MKSTMKEAFVSEDLRVQVRDSPIPELTSPDQLLIKVVVSGTNPKDWKVVNYYSDHSTGSNTGDDIAGIVAAVGADVFEFRVGDRVAAFHQMLAPGGSFAEYAVAHQHTTFHIPRATSFDEAAALPLAAMTAAIGLYRELGLPAPWLPPRSSSSSSTAEPLPLIIYGASSAVGFYALQFALRSGIHPLLCVAGRAARDYIAPLLDASRGDVVIDYRDGDDAVVEALIKATPVSPTTGDRIPLLHALDAISEHNAPGNIARVFAATNSQQSQQKPKVTFVLRNAAADDPGFDENSTTMEHSVTYVGNAHSPEDATGRDFAHVWFRYMARGLQEGWLRGQRTEVIPGGLGGVEAALRGLKEGRNSGVKYVLRIGETEGVEG